MFAELVRRGQPCHSCKIGQPPPSPSIPIAYDFVNALLNDAIVGRKV